MAAIGTRPTSAVNPWPPDRRVGPAPSGTHRGTVLDRLVGGTRPAWHALAACRGQGTDAFFLDRGHPSTAAATWCEGCPVRTECLEHALTVPERHGTWGGVLARDRDGMRRQARQEARQRERERAEEERRREVAERESRARKAERDRQRNRERYRQLRARIDADPVFAERYRQKVNADCRAYYDRRKARLAEDPEALAMERKRRQTTSARNYEARQARQVAQDGEREAW